ncbi:MAG: hypothetical protein OXC11_10810 [Rhodospirillales bacterium]|nr:hypothetical protein [Rhodospirillales bacterium]
MPEARQCRDCPNIIPARSGPGRPRVICVACSAKARRRRNTKYLRKRYATDDAFRAQRLANNRASKGRQKKKADDAPPDASTPT